MDEHPSFLAQWSLFLPGPPGRSVCFSARIPCDGCDFCDNSLFRAPDGARRCSLCCCPFETSHRRVALLHLCNIPMEAPASPLGLSNFLVHQLGQQAPGLMKNNDGTSLFGHCLQSSGDVLRRINAFVSPTKASITSVTSNAAHGDQTEVARQLPFTPAVVMRVDLPADSFIQHIPSIGRQIFTRKSG